MNYTIRDLQEDFPDEEACLEWLINYRFPDGVTCRKCEKVTKHYKDTGRRSYSCGDCGTHFHPTAGTVMYASKVPLVLWFYAVHRLTTTRSGYPATQLQREIGVSYQCAWRMLHKIRQMMGESEGKLQGEVEIDETFIHGNVYKRSSAQRKYGRTGARKGQVVLGLIERGGRTRMHHVPTAGARVVLPIIENDVSFGSTIYTDGWNSYRTLHKRGYKHFVTDHSSFEWTNGKSSTESLQPHQNNR